MTYTANHHLPQWEEADRVRMEDFNGAMGQLEKSLNDESAARGGDKANLQAQINTKAAQTALDALKTTHSQDKANLQTQINKKADQTALNALSTTHSQDKANLQGQINSLNASVGSKGKTCRITFGSYVGTGTGGMGTANVLVTGFYPLLVAVICQNGNSTHSPIILVRPHEAYNVQTYSGMGYCKWGNDRVSFTVKENVNVEYLKLNVKGNTYHYMALGYDL